MHFFCKMKSTLILSWGLATTTVSCLAFNREFQVRLNVTAFEPLQKGIGNLLNFLSTSLPSKCQPLNCFVRLNPSIQPLHDVNRQLIFSANIPNVPGHVEAYTRYETPSGAFTKGQYQLILRSDYEKNSTAVTLKYNHPDLHMVSYAPIVLRNRKDAEEKLEMDIYPCRWKCAKSLKRENIGGLNTTISSVTELDKWFKRVDKVVNGETQLRVIGKPFARYIVKVPAEIGYLSNGKRRVLATKFTFSATYDSVEEAQDAKVKPSVVELSYRLPADSSANGAIDSEKIIKAAWNIFGIVSQHPSVIEKEC